MFSAEAADSPAMQLSMLLRNINSMQGAFLQTSYNAQGKTVKNIVGIMAMQRPNKFRWDISQPRAQLVVADGKKIWVYNPALKQVTVDSLEKNLANTPALLLNATAARITSYFRVAKQGEWYFLQAKSNKVMFEKIYFRFEGKKLVEMRLQDSLGQQAILQFNDLKINVPLNQNLFRFSPPKDVDVVAS
jgi:outer membrane lipoprotein carrier protein